MIYYAIRHKPSGVLVSAHGWGGPITFSDIDLYKEYMRNVLVGGEGYYELVRVELRVMEDEK